MIQFFIPGDPFKPLQRTGLARLGKHPVRGFYQRRDVDEKLI
jgi:hypothetical protein